MPGDYWKHIGMWNYYSRPLDYINTKAIEHAKEGNTIRWIENYLKERHYQEVIIVGGRKSGKEELAKYLAKDNQNYGLGLSPNKDNKDPRSMRDSHSNYTALDPSYPY